MARQQQSASARCSFTLGGPADVLNKPGVLVGECDDGKAEGLQIALNVIGAHAGLIGSIEDS